VILAELGGGIAQRLQQLGDGRILGTEPDRSAGDPDLAQTGAVDTLTGDERGSAGGAALLTVGVGESHPLVGDTIDVGGPVTHQAVAVATEAGDTDVVTPDDEDVGLVNHQLASPSVVEPGSRTMQRKPRCDIEVSIICG
jgi:hypothetical protein